MDRPIRNRIRTFCRRALPLATRLEILIRSGYLGTAEYLSVLQRYNHRLRAERQVIRARRNHQDLMVELELVAEAVQQNPELFRDGHGLVVYGGLGARFRVPLSWA